MKKEFEEFPCDLCGSSNAVEVPYARLYTNDQPVHICRDCGFVYVKYRRPSDVIAEAWSSELYGDLYTARIPAVKARLTYVADFADVEIRLADKTVVDIGAGEGVFLKMVRDEYGASVFGIEPSDTNCDDMRSVGIDCFAGTIEGYAASNDRREADVVTIMWTLEACYSCRDMLGAAHAILKEDGVILIATGSRILVPFKKTLRDYLELEEGRHADTHPFRFSVNTLKGMLAVNGFEPIKVNRHMDSEYLCVIARKRPIGEEIPWKGDDFMQVHDFFERWHRESIHYYPNAL